MPLLDETRLFPVDSKSRDLARSLYDHIRDLPIISPHGHTDPTWFSGNEPFENPSALFVTPDHYVFRMLHSCGVALEDLGIERRDGQPVEQDPRAVWRRFAQNYHLFRGTPSRLWLDYSFQNVFGIDTTLTVATADATYDQINACLSKEAFRPRALFEQFNIETLATTESATDPLIAHKALAASDWAGNIITTYRPDNVIDPDFPGFINNLAVFSEITGEDAFTWNGYLAAHRKRRAEFARYGATATDHGHPSARTNNLSPADAEALFVKIASGNFSSTEAEAFRGQMLTEMARMSVDDGMVMQIHPGSARNHSRSAFDAFGADKGFDIPKPADFVNELRPLLDAFGRDPNLTLILFTLDETTFSRELAPLAGVYPAVKLGPPWWFLDSPDGMRRFREATTETAGFYNTVGFNDDTRAFCSIPARHDVARRVDCAFLADLVVSGRLAETDAFELAEDLSYNLVKAAYKL